MKSFEALYGVPTTGKDSPSDALPKPVNLLPADSPRHRMQLLDQLTADRDKAEQKMMKFLKELGYSQ